MAIIEQDVVVKIRGGEVVFDEPGYNDWAVMVAALNEDDVEKKIDLLLPKIREVRNLEHRDGTPVTKDHIVKRQLDSKLFYTLLFKGWTEEILRLQKGEAGNEPTHV